MNKPRIKGKKVALGLLALITAILVTAIALWWRTREPHGPILALAAVDGRSVMLARRGVAQRDFVHIQEREVGARGQRWAVALYSTQPGATPIIADGRVALRVRDHRGAPETHVFDIEAGRFAFRAGAVTPVPDEALHVSEHASGTDLLVAYGAPISKVVLIDLHGGRARFEHPIAAGPRVPRAVLVRQTAFVEEGDGHVRARARTGGATDLGEGSVCGAGTRAFLLRPDGTLAVLGRTTEETALADLGDAPRIVGCAGGDARAVLVVTSTRGPARTSVITLEGDVPRVVTTLPQRTAPSFSSAAPLPESSAYVVPFESGFVGLFDAAGACKALYRVKNARAPLRADAVRGGAVLAFGERAVIFLDGRPHLLRFEPADGSGVVADADVSGRTLFIAVEREVLALDTRTLAVRERTGDVSVLTEDVTSVLTSMPLP